MPQLSGRGVHRGRHAGILWILRRRSPMRTLFLSSLAVALAAGAVAACSATSDGNGFSTGDPGRGATPGGTGGDLNLTTGNGSMGVGAGVLGEEPPCEGVDPAIDNDDD